MMVMDNTSTSMTLGWRTAGTQAYVLNCGTALTYGTTDTNPHHLRAYANGASSAIRLDSNAAATGSTGPNNTGDTLTVGANYTLTAYSSNDIAFLGIYNGDITSDPLWSSWVSWVSSNYGLTIA